MLWYYNKNEKARDEIVFGEYKPKEYMGGIRRFEDLPVDKLQELADLEYIDLDSQQNDAPTAQQFLDFMRKYPEYKACGYVVSVKRDDYRMIVDGLNKSENGYETLDELDDFYELFRKANKLFISSQSMKVWFD